MQHSPKYKINLETKVRTTFFKFLGQKIINSTASYMIHDMSFVFLVLRVLNGSFWHKYLSNYNF